MSRLQDFSLEDAIKAAVKEFGSDSSMESVESHEELIEWIGESEVPRLVERLDRGE